MATLCSVRKSVLLDVKEKIENDIMIGRNTYEFVSDSSIRINRNTPDKDSKVKTTAADRKAQAFNIAKSIATTIGKRYGNAVGAYIDKGDISDPTYIKLTVNEQFVEQLYENLPEERKQEVPEPFSEEVGIDLSGDSVYFQRANDETPVENNSKIQDLEEQLVNGFLKDFGITVETYNSVKEELGFDAVSMSDLVTKKIVANTKSSILPEVAYFAYSLLGKENDKIKSELNYLINKWEKYRERFDYHFQNEKENGQFVKGKKEWSKKIRSLVILDFIEETLKNQFLNPVAFEKEVDRRWTKEDFTIWKNFLKAVDKFLNIFRVSLTNSQEKKDKLDNISRTIVDELLTQNYTLYKYNIGEEQVQKFYNSTINTDPFAKSIVEHGQSLGMVLTGSLALRRAGSVYRTAEESIHDIDWVIPYELQLQNKESFESILKHQKTDIDFGLKHINKTLQSFDWFNSFVSKFPSYKVINSFYGGEHSDKSSVTVQGVINGDFYTEDGEHLEEITVIVKNKSTKETTKEKRTFSVSHKKGGWIKDTGYVIDFFIRLAPNREQHENYFKLWKEIMIAKLEMGREKDFSDWKVFTPYLKSKNSFDFKYESFRHINWNTSENTQENPESFSEEVAIDQFGDSAYLQQSEPVKEGVNFVFEQTPELSQIGTPEQYSQYLESIFPDSKVEEVDNSLYISVLNDLKSQKIIDKQC